MAYPALIGRMLERPTLNLGFSGNGWMELEVGRLIAELDPAIYVLDNLPNMDAARVEKMTEPLVALLRAARPHTPIVLVENIRYQYTLSDTPTPLHAAKNTMLRAVFAHMRANGVSNIYLVPGEALLGSDGEGTVDGCHPTDLGFLRMAEALTPVLRALLK
jgi:lysophospholipase L1-like esterase